MITIEARRARLEEILAYYPNPDDRSAPLLSEIDSLERELAAADIPLPEATPPAVRPSAEALASDLAKAQARVEELERDLTAALAAVGPAQVPVQAPNATPAAESTPAGPVG